jgi:steroid delta-isomerase-like uncharacterized protein
MSDAMMVGINKFYQVYNEGKTDLWEEAMSPSYVGHVNGQTIPSREVGKGFVIGLLEAFPDINYTIEDMVTQGDKIVSRWSATGTHTGSLFGMPATNKKATMIGITIFRVADGQIAELWDVWDQAGLMQQLNG